MHDYPDPDDYRDMLDAEAGERAGEELDAIIDGRPYLEDPDDLGDPRYTAAPLPADFAAAEDPDPRASAPLPADFAAAEDPDPRAAAPLPADEPAEGSEPGDTAPGI